MSSVAENVPSMSISASVLDNYAAAAGRKYAKLSARIAQKIKSVPVLNKAVEAVKNWDKKMTETHGASYKFAKGAVLGATVGVGLAVAGAEVAAAYTAVNAVRAAGSLLAQAEQARQEGKSAGFSDFAAKNKTAVGLAAVSVGLAAAGVTAGVVENQAVVSAIASTRQAAVGGMMATSTAIKIDKINKAVKNGEISSEQARQAKKEHFAGLAGNLAGLAAFSTMPTQNESFAEAPDLHQAAAERVYDGGTLPETTVTADTPVADPVRPPESFEHPVAPDNVFPERDVPQADPVSPPDPLPDLDKTPETPPMSDPRIAPETPDATPHPQTAPEAPTPDPKPRVERDTFVSYEKMMTSTTHSVNLDISDNINAGTRNGLDESSLFVSVQDIPGSDAKVLSLDLNHDDYNHKIPDLYIDASGKTTPLPDWDGFPDENGDGELSAGEIQKWQTHRQQSLQSVLSEQDAKNVAAAEIERQQRSYNGTETYSVEVQRHGGQTFEPAGSDNSAAQAREAGNRYADKIGSAAREIMTQRSDSAGNAVHVNATEAQIKTTDVLLRSLAKYGRGK